MSEASAQPKTCDHTSVGIIVRNPQRDIAVIKRRNFPIAYAPPAGHCDGDSYPDAAIREAKEEIGVEILSQQKVFEGTFYNPCRRNNGDHHHWQIFEADEWRGTPAAGSDAQELIWLPKSGLVSLASRTAHIAEQYVLQGNTKRGPLAHLLANDLAWQMNPGLELVWCLMLTSMKMIRVLPHI